MPNILFGTNGQIAWGATAGPLDVNDYVQLELNPENPHQYRHGDGWADMRLRQETIKVKGGDDVVADVWESDYGVVQVFDAEHDRAFAFHRTWDGYEIETLMAWIRSTQAQNYDQWLDAAKDVATTINWYYADRDGNIGYVSPGYLPVRQAGQDLRLPAKGDGSQDWQGIRPFADVPKTLNPQQGWIANWNNRSGKGTVSTVEGSPWGGADRVVEIMSRIEAKDRFSPEEVWNILPETSFVDVNARYFVPRILAAGASVPADDPRQPMLAALAAWDTRQIRDADGKATSPAVAILRKWMDVMVADVLLDDAPGHPVQGDADPHRAALGAPQQRAPRRGGGRAAGLRLLQRRRPRRGGAGRAREDARGARRGVRQRRRRHLARCRSTSMSSRRRTISASRRPGRTRRSRSAPR